MLRRILFILFVVVAIIGTALGYFYLKSSKKPKTSVLEVIPIEVDFLIECDDFSGFTNKITTNNLIWEELCQDEYFSSINKDLLYIDSITSSKEEYKKMLEGNRVYFAGLKEKTLFNYLLAFNLRDINQNETAIAFLKTNTSSFETIKTPKTDETCYKIRFSKQQSDLYAYCNNGLILFSNSLNFIDRIISNKGKSGLSSDKNFLKLEEDGGNNMDTRIFIRNSYYSQLLSSRCFQTIPIYKDNNWTALDFDAQANEFRFTGFIDSDSLILFSALKNQKPIEQTFAKYCPKSTEAFYFLGLSDMLDFSKQAEKLISSQELLNDINVISKATEAGIYNEWNRVTNGELAFVEAKINNQLQPFIIACIDDKENACDFLKQVSDTCISLSLKYRDSLYHLSFPSLTAAISVGSFYEQFSSAYVYDNCIVFGKSDSLIKFYLDELNDFGTLASSERYQLTKESNLNNECNFYFYQDLSKNQEEISSYINPTILSVFDKPKERLQKFGYFGFQLSSHKGKILTQSCLHYNPISKEQNLTLWETTLDTVSTATPQVVINHKTGGKELFLSDEKGIVYLISNTGKIQWKKALGEKIIGEVHQIDFFKNEKLQYLFNTLSSIHLIDRNGNYVKGYPIKLPEKASNSIAVFDYENTKDYRIIVACENKKVYNYSINGSLTEGFNFPETKDVVKYPIEFKRIGGKDYLLAIDNSGNIYGTGRKGEQRLIFKNTFAGNVGKYHFENGKDIQHSKFFFTDINEPSLRQLSLDDKLKTNTISTEIKTKNVQYSYINEDKLIDYVLSDETGFEVFDDEGKKLLGYLSKTECKSPIKIITVNNDLYFLFIDANDNLILTDVSGKLVELPKKTFSSLPVIYNINSDAKLYAIGVHRDKLNCYEFLIR